VQAHCGAVTVSATIEVSSEPPESLPDTGSGPFLPGTGTEALTIVLLGFLIALLGLGAAYTARRMSQEP
jgi:LPXTG-motif cell wall-anchored protein